MSAWSHHIVRGALAAATLTACADPGTGPGALDIAASRAPAQGTVPASVEWNAVARGLVAKNRANAYVAFRAYALTSVAQLEALRAAERASTRGTVASARAAMAAASAATLSQIFPGDAASLEAAVRQQVGSPEWLERRGIDAAAGEAAGRAAAAAVLEQAKTDRFFDPWTGTIPTGEGIWFSSTLPPTPPPLPALGKARTWFMTSGAQFRPAPPPAFGSPAFLEAVAEVRHISDTRTPAQDSIAKFWALTAGTYTPPGWWNEEASTLAVRHHMNEERAARMLALMNMVAMDAIIASHEAKYHYWLLRPSQADPAITTSFALPNFPAYPSNHATISAAMAEVLAEAFPGEARRLRAAADEAALSRVYGGIHYRFDGDAGLAMGRNIARWALDGRASASAPGSVVLAGTK